MLALAAAAGAAVEEQRRHPVGAPVLLKIKRVGGIDGDPAAVERLGPGIEGLGVGAHSAALRLATGASANCSAARRA